MLTVRLFLVGLLASLCPHLGWSQSGSLKTDCVLSLAASQVGVREATGNNDGPMVETYLRASGNHRGEEWCGAFQCWLQQHCGLPCPQGAGAARNWFAPLSRRTYYIRGRRGGPGLVQPGHVCGFYYPWLGRIGHIGRIEAVTRNGFITVEGNTGQGGGRTGAGVHRLARSRGDIYSASNWSY